MANDLRITTVRHGPEKARQLLADHVFGGKYKLPRVPRGIDRAFVSKFITESIKPDSPRDAYFKTLDVVRFYERPDVVPHLLAALNRREAEFVDLMRSLGAIQAAGDVGAPEQGATAAAYLDAAIIPHAKAETVYPTIGETLVVLAPSGSPAGFRKRIEREIQIREPLQNDSEEAMMAFDKVVEVRDQTLAGAEAASAGKKGLLAKKPPERAPDLVAIYLGKHALAGRYMSTWAARRIRFDAAEIGFDTHKALFAKAVDAIDPEAEPNPETDLVLVRAVQAIIYFQQAPTIAHLERYAKAKNRGAIHMNFLWDDDE